MNGGIGNPQDYPWFNDLLGRLRGLSIYSTDLFITAKGYKANSAKGEGRSTEVLQEF